MNAAETFRKRTNTLPFSSLRLPHRKIRYNKKFMLNVICHTLGAALLLLGIWIILPDWYVFISLHFTKSERWNSFSFTPFAGGILGCATLRLLPPTREMGIRWLPILPDSGVILYSVHLVKQFFKFLFRRSP